MLEELGREVGVPPVVVGQHHRDLQQVQRVAGHPRGTVALLQHPGYRQVAGPVERPDVVQPEEAALEDVVAARVLAVHPPGEVHQQLVQHPLEEREVAGPVDLEDLQRRPGVHRRVHVVEGPLVGRQLPVGVHVPLAQDEQQLLLGEIRIDQRQRDAVEGKVPRGVPGILPLVRHREDVGIVEVLPAAVAAVPALGRRGRLARIAAQPGQHLVVVELLAPEQSRERLPLHPPGVLGHLRRAEALVERIRLSLPLREDVLGIRKRRVPAAA